MKKAIEDLKSETGKEGIWLELDLADLGSVEKAAEEFKSKEKQLHVLFNNALVVLYSPSCACFSESYTQRGDGTPNPGRNSAGV